MEATQVLGDVTDPGYADRRVDTVLVPWGDARKHRQVLTTVGGRPLRVTLPRGTYLHDGAVLADDGTTVVAVTRPPEDAVVVEFADNVGTDAVRRALVYGYILGNRHAPLDVSADRVSTPLTTSAGTAEQLLRDLQLTGRVDSVPLAAHGWTNTSADHHHSHSHEDGSDHSHSHSHSHGLDHDHSHDPHQPHGVGHGH